MKGHIRQSWWRTRLIGWIKAGHSFTVSSSILGPTHRSTSYTFPLLTTTNQALLNDFCLSGCVISLQGSLVWMLRIQQMDQKDPFLSEICSFTHFEPAKKKKTRQAPYKNDTSHILRYTPCTQSFWHLIMVYLRRWGFVNRCVPL